ENESHQEAELWTLPNLGSFPQGLSEPLQNLLDAPMGEAKQGQLAHLSAYLSPRLPGRWRCLMSLLWMPERETERYEAGGRKEDSDEFGNRGGPDNRCSAGRWLAPSGPFRKRVVIIRHRRLRI